jgi:hypothetical protein
VLNGRTKGWLERDVRKSLFLVSVVADLAVRALLAPFWNKTHVSVFSVHKEDVK